MIFSLSKTLKDFSFAEEKNLDVFCFFKSLHSVDCPKELWFEAICTSLKMKHSVLILEEEVTTFPDWDASLRWQTGENWCWLAPRALGAISKAYPQNPPDFTIFKSFLTLSK